MKFKISKQEIERVDDEKIASFARNHIYVTFDFDEFWKDLHKYALFVSPDENKYIVDLGYGQDLSCIVPEEVLQASFFKVSCYGGDRLTTMQQTVLVYPSGYSEDIEESDDTTIIIDDEEIHRVGFDKSCFVRPQKEFEKNEHIHP